MYRETQEDDCSSPALPVPAVAALFFTLRRNLLPMPGVYIYVLFFLNNVLSIKGRSRIGCRPANQLTSDNFESFTLHCRFAVNGSTIDNVS